jgi:hypothetical protein
MSNTDVIYSILILPDYKYNSQILSFIKISKTFTMYKTTVATEKIWMNYYILCRFKIF